MTIDLIRHFKVDFDFSHWITASDLPVKEQEYDRPHRLLINEANSGFECPARLVSSDLNRAVTTARTLFAQDPIQDSRLREFPLQGNSWFKGRLPGWLWLMINKRRAGEARRRQFSQDILECLREHLDVPHLTIVSHGFVMIELQKHLRALGFRGKGFRVPKNAVLYRFEK